jgi:hypothetical protein
MPMALKIAVERNSCLQQFYVSHMFTYFFSVFFFEENWN